jgi:hypothetical protein
MKDSYFRLTQSLPYYIVHWNTEVIDVSAFQSDAFRYTCREDLVELSSED